MISTESTSAMEPLAPLVREGYKTLAVRAANGLNRWYSSLDPVLRPIIDNGLSSISLPESKPAPVLYAVTGGRIEKRTRSKSGSLLEDSVSSAREELATLSDNGDAGGINLGSFSRLFFAFDYSVFVPPVPEKHRALGLARKVADGYYSANGRQEFVEQLNSLSKLKRIMISAQQEDVGYTEDWQLYGLIFMASDNNPAVLNVINGLRLIYLAANVTIEKHSGDLSGLRERIRAVAEAKGVASQIPEDYWQDDSNLQSINSTLDSVSLHRGVETIIAECNNLPPRLVEILLLTKVLDTVNTGKVAIGNKDKPYSDAIGIAELIA